ncbi:MAG: TetR/AcrR family transcriptional regulator [Pseudomonadota bacterium]
MADSSNATSAFDDKRAQLLRAAARCFNEKGYSGTSLKDVARLLGLTDAAIYYYIDGKQQLVYECYLHAADIGARALDDAVATGGNGLQVARHYIAQHVAALCGDAGPVAIMSEIPSLLPDHRDDIMRRSRAHSVNFENVLRQGIADSSIAHCDVRMTGNAIMSAVNWIPKWFHGDPMTAQQVIQTYPDFLCRGLAAR